MTRRTAAAVGRGGQGAMAGSGRLLGDHLLAVSGRSFESSTDERRFNIWRECNKFPVLVHFLYFV